MACNFLQPRASSVDVRGSDTLSEISESGTGTSGWTSSWDSREDLRDFVTKIGLKDVADLHQDRFRVDRKKLEQMLSGDNEAPLPADIFFEQIMSDTGTFITWPSKLKIGAKSKKDPHVRIAGRPDDVRAAKDRIMTVLDTRCNRVTMKMDVSYTDHSHIIGKGGLSIKRVMEETQCHVHFPDSNRSNPTEKSNQVSIAGDIQGVELARSRVRQKTPVVFGFELPIMTQNVDPTCPYIIKIQEQYNIQVMMRTRPKLHATLVLVKGVEWEVDQVKRATMLLVEYLCENLASQIPIQMSMEISPHHHPMVIGKNHSNIKEIMRISGAQIMFPDAQDPNIPSLKKSNITITGHIHSVYIARQLLIGSLPLLLMFDLPENTSGLPTKVSQVGEIQNKFDVIISIRHKPKQNTMACIIKGFERSASNIYKARNAILAIDEQSVMADIPSTYLMPNCTSALHSLYSSSSSSGDLPTPTNTHPPQLAHSVTSAAAAAMSPMLSPLISPPTWHYPTPTNNYNHQMPPQQQQQTGFVGMMTSAGMHGGMGGGGVGGYGMVYGGAATGSMHQSLSSSGYHSLGQISGSTLSLLEQSRDNSTYSSISSNSSMSSPVKSPRHNSPYQNRKYSDSSNSDKPGEFLSALSEMSQSGGYHGPSVDKRLDKNAISPCEYEQKRIAGYKAMQSRQSGPGYRYPTNSWSGYGISHTTSGIALNEKQSTSVKQEEDNIWKTPTTKQSSFDYNLTPHSSCSPSNSNSNSNSNTNSTTPNTTAMNTSNYLDHTPSNILSRITSCKWPDLITLLTSLGLEKYITLFNTHEMDLGTFASITDKDLVEIGVTAFGARRKMLLAIAELNKRANTFSPAPGAERKSSSSSSTLSNPCTPEKTTANRLGW